jgi:hypothetical protein
MVDFRQTTREFFEVVSDTVNRERGKKNLIDFKRDSVYLKGKKIEILPV